MSPDTRLNFFHQCCQKRGGGERAAGHDEGYVVREVGFRVVGSDWGREGVREEEEGGNKRTYFLQPLTLAERT